MFDTLVDVNNCEGGLSLRVVVHMLRHGTELYTQIQRSVSHSREEWMDVGSRSTARGHENKRLHWDRVRRMQY